MEALLKRGCSVTVQALLFKAPSVIFFGFVLFVVLSAFSVKMHREFPVSAKQSCTVAEKSFGVLRCCFFCFFGVR